MKKGFSWFLLVIILGLIFTIIFTWPFILKLNICYQDFSDVPFNGWILWYNQFAIKTGIIFNQNRYFNANIFYPFPYSLAFSEFLLIPSLFFSAFYWLTNSLVLANNLVIMFSFVFSFISSFYMINYFVKNKLAALVGAFIYTFNPLTYSHFPDQPQLLTKYWLPLILIFSYRFFLKPNLKDGFFLGLFLALNALSSINFQIYAVITMVIIFIIISLSNFIKRRWRYFIKLFLYGLVFVPFFLVILYFYYPYLEFSKKEAAIWTIEENIHYSASLTDWFMPYPSNLIYGNLVKQIEKYRWPKEDWGKFSYSERTLALNIIPIILFGFGLLELKNSKNKNKLFLLSCSLILGSSFIMSFGPYYGDIKLPYYYLYKNFYLLQATRVPSRYQFLFYLPFSLFCAYGITYILKKSKKSTLWFFLAMLLLLIENLYFYNVSSSYIFNQLNNYKIKNSQIFGILHNKKTLHLPTVIFGYRDFESRYLTWSTFTEEYVMNGNSSYIPKDIGIFFDLFINKKNSAIEKIKLAKSIGLNMLVVHKDLLTNENLRHINSFHVNSEEEIIELQKQYFNLTDSLRFTKVFEDNNLLILDLDKSNLKVKRCDLIRNFSYDLKSEFVQPDKIIGYTLKVKNNDNCYFSALYSERYLEANIFVNDKKNQFFIKLPIIITPKQEIKITGEVDLTKILNQKRNKPEEIKFVINKLNIHKNLLLK